MSWFHLRKSTETTEWRGRVESDETWFPANSLVVSTAQFQRRANMPATQYHRKNKIGSLFGWLALVTLPLLLALLALAKMPAMLTDPTALDHAQLARELASGHGFSTAVLRPLAVTLQRSEARHLDLVNAPLHPVLLSAFFTLVDPAEKISGGLGLGLWVLTVWLVFWVVRYWWNGRTAGLATVFCACGTAGLLGAAAGLPQPLMALLVFGAVAAVFPKPSRAQTGDVGLALWQPAVAGLLCGGAVLTDYRLLPLALVLAVYLAKSQARWWDAVTLFLGSFLLLVAPWCLRNFLASGHAFGLFGYTLLENTHQFPGESIWRLTDESWNPLFYLLFHPLDLLRKLGLGLLQYRSVGLGLLDPVLLVLGVVAAFGSPANSSRRRLARLALSSAALTVLLACATRPDTRLLLAWAPLLGGVAAAQLMSWVQANVDSIKAASAPVPGRRWRREIRSWGRQTSIYGGIIGLVAFPVIAQLSRPAAPELVNGKAMDAALNKSLLARGPVLTDVPEFMAWRLNRPALLVCQQEADLVKIERQTGRIAGLYLSPAVREIPERERGDWWLWAVNSRGVYRGLTVAASPLPGILRVPQDVVVLAGDRAKELADLQAAVANNPQSPEAQTQLGIADLQLGRLQEASAAFQAALRLDSYNAEALTGLWQTSAQLRQSDGTLRLAQLVAQVGPHDPRAKPLLEQAAAHFDQLAAVPPGDPWVLLNLITCRARLGQWAEVATDSVRLSQVLPSIFPAHLLLADLYLQQGETAKAAAECDPLLRENPALPTAHLLAGRVALAQGKLEEALADFVEVAKLRPHWAEVHVLAGQVCQQLKRDVEAVGHLKTALQLAPNQTDFKLKLAEIYNAQGKTGEAAGLYRGLLATNPHQPVALNNLAELLARDGKAAEALPLALRAIDLAPQNPHFRDTAGWVAFQVGNQEDAILHLREAVRLAPTLGVPHYHLAKVLLASGQSAAAAAEFQAALTHDLPAPAQSDASAALQKKL